MEEPDQSREDTYQPMEWGVLLNDIGGRPFQAWKTQWYGNTERVVEYYVQPGSREPREGLGWVVSNTIKCHSEEEARACAALLNEAYLETDKAMIAARDNRARVMNRAADMVRKIVGQVEQS